MRDSILAASKPTQRNLGLDFIKILATIAVIGLHTVATKYSRVNLLVYCFCGCAMPLFFMTNGYLTLTKQKIDYLYSIQKIRNILILTLFWNILSILFDFIKTKNLTQAPTDILGPYIQRGVMYQFWFLGTLIIIYLALPLLKYIFDRPKLKWPLFGLLFAACTALTVLSVIRHAPVVKPVPQPFRLWTWLFYYFLGGILKQYQYKITKFLNFKLHTLLLVIFTAGYMLFQDRFFADAIKNRLAEYTYDSLAIMLWVTALFLFFLRLDFDAKPKLAGIVTWLTPLMFGCYIVHVPYVTLLVFKLTKLWNINYGLLNFGSVLLISLLAVFILRKIKFVSRFLSY